MNINEWCSQVKMVLQYFAKEHSELRNLLRQNKFSFPDPLYRRISLIVAPSPVKVLEISGFEETLRGSDERKIILMLFMKICKVFGLAKVGTGL